jgi:hypothetical protein
LLAAKDLLQFLSLAQKEQKAPEGLSVAEKTIKKFLIRAIRLYEEGEPSGSPCLNRTWGGERDEQEVWASNMWE